MQKFLKNTAIFFINKNNASYEDMNKLIEFVKKKSKNKNWHRSRNRN